MVTVLIADDEPYVVELVRITLEDSRVRVLNAFDGGTALALADAFVPDVVFLDVEMPEVSGVEVCRRLRLDPRFGATLIIMLTAAAQKEDVALGIAAGADQYLTKPFSPVGLLSLLDELMPRAALWLPQ